MLQPGSYFSVPGTPAVHGATTVVLVTLKDCFATAESVGFYKKLTERTAAMPGVTFIVLSPDSTDAMRSWLNANELHVEKVAQIADPAAVGILLSPTLLVLNQVGIADTVFAGRLSPGEEAAILGRLTGGPTRGSIGNVPGEIEEAALQGLQKRGGVEVVDVSERTQYLRSSRSGSLNIPLVELPVRARIELSIGRQLVLECPPKVASSCPAAGTFLRQQGFEQVSLLYSGFEARER